MDFAVFAESEYGPDYYNVVLQNTIKSQKCVLYRFLILIWKILQTASMNTQLKILGAYFVVRAIVFGIRAEPPSTTNYKVTTNSSYYKVRPDFKSSWLVLQSAKGPVQKDSFTTKCQTHKQPL